MFTRVVNSKQRYERHTRPKDPSPPPPNVVIVPPHRKPQLFGLDPPEEGGLGGTLQRRGLDGTLTQPNRVYGHRTGAAFVRVAPGGFVFLENLHVRDNSNGQVWGGPVSLLGRWRTGGDSSHFVVVVDQANSDVAEVPEDAHRQSSGLRRFELRVLHVCTSRISRNTP